MRAMYPFGDLHRTGAGARHGQRLGVTTADPLQQLEVAVRRLPCGEDGEAFLPEQRLTLATALAAFTAGSAHVNGDDDAGSLQVGRRADLAVVDRDLFACPGRQGRVPARVELTDGRPAGRTPALRRDLAETSFGIGSAGSGSVDEGGSRGRSMTSSTTSGPGRPGSGGSGPGAVQLRGLQKRYGGVVAVDHVDIDVRAGEFLSLLGPSGCGKTTTLRMLAGFEQPDRGEILISGRPCRACRRTSATSTRSSRPLRCSRT
jgi:ABC-type multidrug transport system fused ATPase/permease subunit